MQGSKATPKNRKDYSSADLNVNLIGTKFESSLSGTTVHDIKINDDMIIDGAVIIVIGSALGDKITCQVVDKDNVMGYGVNVILGQYVTDWYLNPSATFQLNYESEYPAKIYAGLYLRTVYSAIGTGSIAANIIVNYKLHKILW